MRPAVDDCNDFGLSIEDRTLGGRDIGDAGELHLSYHAREIPRRVRAALVGQRGAARL
jgi:hypothetical protein